MAEPIRKGKKRGGKSTSKNSSEPQEQMSNTGTPDCSSNEALQQDSFERELQWCIQQLEMGLKSTQANSKKGQEAMKILKILRSSKAPMIKKRQVMRMNFGDYRKKMEDEEKKYATNPKKLRLQAVEGNAQKKLSTYLKKSMGFCAEKSQTEFVGVQHTFAFNFAISDIDTPRTGDIEQTANNGVEGTDSAPEATDTVNTSFNYYKMNTGDGGFKFSFAMEDADS